VTQPKTTVASSLRGRSVARIAQLWRYPVKSMAGERLDRAYLGLDGIPSDRLLYVVGELGDILSARTKPRLLAHRATIAPDGEVLVDGLPWRHPQVGAAIEAAAGPGARLVEATGNERFDILPLLVATDGAIDAFGHDARRLRPNIVLEGVPGLTERDWQWRQLAAGDAVIALADLRARCVTTTWDPETLEQDVDVLRRIRANFGGTLALNACAGWEGHVAIGDDVRLLDRQIEFALPEPGRFA
jgi:MOSC domain-containing protein